MIVTDTNALAEAPKPRSDPTAMRTITRLMEESTLTAITLAELIDGARRLPRGRTRSRYEAHVRWLRGAFDKRILDFTAEHVDAYGSVRDFEGVGLELINPWDPDR